MFIGRKEELKELKEIINSKKFESTLIKGRRRVGKTELIFEATKNVSKVLRYECKNSTVESNLVSFSEVINKFFNIPINNYFKTFDDLFDFLFEKSVNEKFILVIDEFTFLLNNSYGIDSLLAIRIDQYHNKSKLKLIISGSEVGIIEQMTSYKAHLFGRFNHIITLYPFDYFEASLFYENYSNEDKVLMYSCFGGVAYFNSLIDPSISAIDNIKKLILKKDSIIEHEINEIILNETNKINDFNYTIELIGSGISKYKDINSCLGKDKKPDYILSKLEKLAIIKKVFPINAPNNKKRIKYILVDNLIHFYYRFIYRNLNERNYLNVDTFFDLIKERIYKEYIPLKFEQIANQYLIRKNINNQLKYPFHLIGTYYFDSKNNENFQFDIVTKDSKGYISYECKYTNEKLGLNVVNEEIEATNKCKDISFYKLGFISKSGFKDNVDKDKYICIELEDFYK